MSKPWVTVTFMCNILDAINEQYPEFGECSINEGFRGRIARLEKYVTDKIDEKLQKDAEKGAKNE